MDNGQITQVSDADETPITEQINYEATSPIVNTIDLETVKNKILARVGEATSFIDEHFRDNFNLFYDQYRIVKGDKSEDDWHADQILPIIFGIINTKKPQLKKQLIPEEMFFGVEADKDNVEEETVDPTTGQVVKKAIVDYEKSARLHETIIKKQLDNMNFHKTFDELLTDMFIFKYAGLSVNWKYITGTREYFDIKDGQVKQIEEANTVLYDAPCVDSVAPFDLMIDPKARTLNTARYIIHRNDISVEYVRSNPTIYNLPDVEAFLTWADENEAEYVTVYDYYEGNGYGCRSVTTITENGEYLLKRHANPYKHGKYPFLVTSEYPLQRCTFGMSTAEVVSDIQTYESDLTNLEADMALLSVIPTLIINEDAAIDGRNFDMSPGKPLILPQGYNGRFEPFKMPSSGLDGEKMFARFQGIINQGVGNLEYMNPSRLGNGVNRTATGAEIINENLQTKASDKADDLRNDILRPMLYMLLELNQQYLTVQEAVKLIGEKKAKELIIEPEYIDWVAKYDFKITGEDGRLTKTQHLNKLLQFSQIIKNVPELKNFIKGDKFAEKIIRTYDLPEDIVLNAEEQAQAQIPQGQPQSEDEQFNQIITQLSQMTGKQPEMIMQELAAGKKPQDYMAEMGGGVQGV